MNAMAPVIADAGQWHPVAVCAPGDVPAPLRAELHVIANELLAPTLGDLP